MRNCSPRPARFPQAAVFPAVFPAVLTGVFTAVFTAGIAGCRGVPALPAGTGPGLVAFDPAPPEGARTWPRPTWRAGDRFSFLRGGQQRLDLTVAAATREGYTLVDASGNRLRRGLDLSNIGEWPPEGDEALHELTPPDVRFHWPLWVGKRWRCRYVDRTAGGEALEIETSYAVEDVDTVTTPAGTFEALRIVRTSRLHRQGGLFLDRINVIWYAPEPGLEVRQVFGDTSLELVAWQSAPVAGR